MTNLIIKPELTGVNPLHIDAEAVLKLFPGSIIFNQPSEDLSGGRLLIEPDEVQKRKNHGSYLNLIIGINKQKSCVEEYTKKAVISGDIVEIYEYEKPIFVGYEKLEKEKIQGRSSTASMEEKVLNRQRVQNRARRDLKRLINSNAGRHYDKETGELYSPKFLTFTFADNVTDLDQANREWKKFRLRLEYRLKKKIEYVVVVEFQKRGAVHYHAVFFNLPWTPAKLISQVWGQGFIKINRIEEVDNIGAYVSKYMGKNVEDDKLIGEKSYFSSRGLFKPVELTDKESVENTASELKEYQVYETTFQNDYVGLVRYRQFNIRRKHEPGPASSDEGATSDPGKPSKRKGYRVMKCSEDEVCRGLGQELGRSVEWSEVIEAVGEDMSNEVLQQDVNAIIQMRGAFGLAPFC